MHRNRQHTGTFTCKNHAKCANYCLQIKCFVYRTNYAQHNNCHKLNLSFKTYIMQQIWEISIYIYQGLSTNVIRLRPLRQVNVLGFGLIHCRWPQACSCGMTLPLQWSVPATSHAQDGLQRYCVQSITSIYNQS